MHGLGFNRYASKYLSAVKVDGAGTFPAGEKTPWTINKFVSDWFSFTGKKPGNVYPFIGGTAAAHKVDLFNVFTLTFNGTITHNSNGVTGDGSTGYAIIATTTTIFNNANKCSFGVYSRTNSATAKWEMGDNTGTPKLGFFCRSVAGNAGCYMHSSTLVQTPVADSLGLFWVRRHNASEFYMFHNSTLLFGNTIAPVGIPTSNFDIMAATGSPASERNLAFAFVSQETIIGTGYANFYTMIQNLQTFLGRQV